MEDNSKNRVVRWTQKLLDLSLRNRLLNARDSKQILPLAVDDVASLEDRLSADQAVAVEPSDSQSRSAGALRSTLASDDMLRRLKEIFRLAKTDLEESGVNALYLALGFLKWRPKGANAKECRAPILLMPVQMTRKNVREGYTVSRLDDDTMLNATLVEFLRAEFGISVSGLDPLPEDDSGVDVAKVFATFREAVKGMEGWDIEEDAARSCESEVDIVQARMPAKIRPATIAAAKPCFESSFAISMMIVSEVFVPSAAQSVPILPLTES
jgi:hypothetical protein